MPVGVAGTLAVLSAGAGLLLLEALDGLATANKSRAVRTHQLPKQRFRIPQHMLAQTFSRAICSLAIRMRSSSVMPASW